MRVEAPEWISVARVKVVQNGTEVAVLDAEDRQGTVLMDRELDLQTPVDCWLVVVAEGEKDMAPAYCDKDGWGAVPLAVTNPFWVDADGDCELTLPARGGGGS